MTNRERELVAAALVALEHLSFWQPSLHCTSRLRTALAAYEPSPIASEPSFDGRDGGRMHQTNSGAE